MNAFIISHKIFIQKLLVLFLGLFATITMSGQTTITHNIGTQGNLTIPGNSTNDYIITGTTTTNKVIIQTGYMGTVTLSNLNMTSSTTATNDGRSGVSCITVEGEFNRSNLNPITVVNLILEGTNALTYTQSSYCAIQVNQGAQIHINAIDPNDNTSGTLEAKCTASAGGSTGGGAAIGAPNFPSNSTYNDTNCQGTSTSSCNGSTIKTAGGNIIIGSGTVTVQGGHAAGIGGGWYTYYNGIIIVYGGIVDASTLYHAAGIGSGCPAGGGVTSCYAENSTIIALPPCVITATGRGSGNADPNLGLAGAKNIIYINDPAKPLNTVRTEDYEPNATIYLDLTLVPGLVSTFATLGVNHNLAKIKIGKTDVSGLFTIHAIIEQDATFFTDHSSTNPDHPGRPYLPVTTKILAATTVVLPLLDADISFTDFPSTPLETGYSLYQAQQNAQCIKVEYNDPVPFTNMTFTLEAGIDFSSLIFLGPDSTTVILAPTTLTSGYVFYIIVPINIGKPLGIYNDVLQINGEYSSVPLGGSLRRVIEQRVVYNDTQTNTYIKVTATPPYDSWPYPSSNVVILNLNINHQGLSVTYDPSDVTAKYLITTESDYNAALAATPLSSWPALNIPAAENVNTPTTASFSGKPVDTYYIHWYVVSGLVYAHSQPVTGPPPAQYGGFGPYIIYYDITPGVISGRRYICSEESVQLTGTASSGGSGSFTYQWQISSDGSSWSNIGGATGQNYTTGALTSVTYFRRQTMDGSTGPFYSNVIQISITPSEMYWKSGASNNNWNDPSNWANQSGTVLNAVPASCTAVHIPGTATNFPSLDDINTDRDYGDPVCDKIYFHFGGEVAKPHLLTYTKAFVEYNFGYYSGSTYQTGGDSHSATPMQRGQWYALATPLNKITPGDFSFGGKPNAWQQAFVKSNSSGVFVGEWEEPHSANATDIPATQYNGIAIWIANIVAGNIGEDASYHTNLNTLQGLVWMPYFEDATISNLHRIHQYTGSESQFYYYEDTHPDQAISAKYDAITRGNEAYRFVFHGVLQSTYISSENGNYETFRLEVPGGKELMLGNPFLSNLDFDKFYQINQSVLANGTYRLYVNNNWGQQYTYGSGSGSLTKYIAPLQAFFIQTQGSGTVNLLFPPDLVSVTVPTNKLKAAGMEDIFDNVLYIEASNKEGSSWATLCMKEGTNVDQLFNNDESYVNTPQIYLSDGNSKNAVQFMPDGKEIPIGIHSQDQGKNILRFKNADRFHTESLILHDKVTGIAYSLLHGVNEIEFDNFPNVPDRFLLQVGTQTTEGIAKNAGIFVYMEGRKLSVEAGEVIRQVTVANIQGLILLNNPSVNSRSFSMEMNIPSGIYIVNVMLENGENRVEKVSVW